MKTTNFPKLHLITLKDGIRPDLDLIEITKKARNRLTASLPLSYPRKNYSAIYSRI